MIKQRKESADIYKEQNRMDLYQKEVDESAVIEEYLPKQLGEEEIVRIIKTGHPTAGSQHHKKIWER